MALFNRWGYTVLGVFILAQSAMAHPVIWKGGQAVMVKSDTAATDVTYHYSLNYNWSLGGRYITFKDTDQSYVIGQSNWLLNRWNGPDSQGNLYALSGIGFPIRNGGASPMWHVGAQADWETRRVYTLFRAEYYAADTGLGSLTGRIGFAPYAGEFDDIHTWLILQVDDVITADRHSVSVMPVVRLFKDNILVEFGSNFSGETHIAAMLHF